MNSPSNIPSNVVPIDADERIYRNLSKNDQYGAALPLTRAERQRLIQNVLTAADNAASRDRPLSGRRSLLFFAAAAAGLLIVGAGIGVFVFGPRHAARPAEDTARLADRGAAGPSLENKTSAPGPSQPNARSVMTLEGPSVSSPSKGIDLSLLAESKAEVRHPSASETEIRLLRGGLWVAVNPEAPHDRLTVVTEDGRVEVKGTVFYVSKNVHRSEVQVLRGLVQVTDRKGRRTSLPAGRKKDIGVVEDLPLEPADIESGWASVESAALASRPSVEKVDRPISVDRKREHSEKAPRSEAVLLGEIRQKRLSGEWQDAATLYETLIQTYKRSPAARAALISLGELRLEKLHAPGAALSLFEQYLSLSEPTLAREALLGKADALRALGRKEAETKALFEFLRRYPDAVQADSVRRRLEVLKTDTR